LGDLDRIKAYLLGVPSDIYQILWFLRFGTPVAQVLAEVTELHVPHSSVASDPSRSLIVSACFGGIKRGDLSQLNRVLAGGSSEYGLAGAHHQQMAISSSGHLERKRAPFFS
jgi:hypothetical protein